MKQYIPDISPFETLWIAKLLGALAGSAISLAYVLPAGKREAAIRFLTGLTAGLVFGFPTGLWIADSFSFGGRLNDFEIALMGAAFSSLAIWTALGFALRFVDRRSSQLQSTQEDKGRDI
ncbi:DUF6107 family protein [Ahrensia kielensis]|uniref:DUF6107 family protein n=1 Tax=Ahrensia kielensis TaxID=76980 RepID=UPI000363BF52|nr:DUF6107 family protein [Ahrensia kielensis]